MVVQNPYQAPEATRMLPAKRDAGSWQTTSKGRRPWWIAQLVAALITTTYFVSIVVVWTLMLDAGISATSMPRHNVLYSLLITCAVSSTSMTIGVFYRHIRLSVASLVVCIAAFSAFILILANT